MKATLRQVQQSLILSYFSKSQVDYGQYYLQLYAAYNVWYRSSTGESLDARALAKLKGRSQIWQDCFDDRCMLQLRSLMRRVYVLTTHRPLVRDGFAWSGRLEDETDWRGLLDFWYAVRCDVVHGNDAQAASHYPLLLKLAYESLAVFMTEIVSRLRLSDQYGVVDDSLDDVSKGMRRYLYSPDATRLDLAPASDFAQLASLRRD